MPTLKVDNDIITESGVITQYLADIHNGAGLLPGIEKREDVLLRARIQFFVETWFSKIQPSYFAILKSVDDNEASLIANALVAAIKKEIEPMLEDSDPYFGGSKKLTLAEVSNIIPVPVQDFLLICFLG